MKAGVGETHAETGVNISSRRIALIAGGGKIPIIIAAHIAASGAAPYIVMLKGDADQTLTKYKHCELTTAGIGKLIATLKAMQIQDVVFVGSVKGRPNWSNFRPDLTTLKLIFGIISVLRRGDNNLLSRVVGVIEDEGIRVLGAHEVMPELLSPLGSISGKTPDKKQMSSIRLGVEAAMALGSLDAGQGCVVVGQRIVALEGVEGTDEMLKRVALLKEEGRLPNKRGGVLVKMCKPQQDKRVDMPTIGLPTVDNANTAKLDGIAIHGGSSLIVDYEAVTEATQKAKMFLYGVDETIMDRLE